MESKTIPEITVRELAAKIFSLERFVLLDVREPWELTRASILDNRLKAAPLSRLSQEGITALPQAAQSKDAIVFVICHHGNRSLEVTRWLMDQGWKTVFNVRGGIDAYAHEIDQKIGFY